MLRSILVLLVASLISLSCVHDARAIPVTPAPDKFELDTGYIDERIPVEIRRPLLQQGLFDISKIILQTKSAELREVVINNPDDPYPMHALGTITFYLQGEREAQALWAAAHKKDQNLAPPDLMMAIHSMFAAQKSGDTAKATTLLQDIEKRFRQDPHFLMMQAEQAMRGRKFDEAGRAFTRAHELAPKLYVTALNLGRYKAFMGNTDEALVLMRQSASLAPHRAETWWNLGTLQTRLQQEGAAVESFAKVATLAPQGPSAEARLAATYATQENYEAAAKWYTTALAGQPSAPEKARIQGVLGDILLRLGKRDEARKQIEGALSYRELPQLVFALGTIDEEQGMTVEAEKKYRRVLELVPENPLAANNLAMLLVKENRALPEALSLSEMARKGIPNNAIIESTYGCALCLSGRHAEAIEILGSVLSGSVQDSWARYCLGLSLYQSGRKDEAVANFKRLLRDDPDFEQNAEIQKML